MSGEQRTSEQEVEALQEEIAKCRELIPSMFQAEDLHVMVARLVEEFRGAVKEANTLAVENAQLLIKLTRSTWHR